MRTKRLEEMLAELADSDLYPFHMPGHKRVGGEPFARDITEIDGFDNLHDPAGILKTEMDSAAELYGVKSTHFLVNGSTCGILAAISAAVPAGGTLMAGRLSHLSVYHAAYLRRLNIVYTDAGGKIPASLPEGSVQAVLITSPSYEGCVRDIRAWAEAAHRSGAVLIVDEAHGAHFGRHPSFPASAAQQGADLVIQSLHKTLPAMTQCAVLHNVTGRISDEQLEKFLRIYETSSPSYVLMASAAAAVHKMADGGAHYFDAYLRRLRNLRRELASLRCLRLAGGEEGILSRDDEIPPFRAGTVTDPGKLLILTAPYMSGDRLYEILIRRYRLQPEMKTPDAVLLMTSVCDTDEGFARLLAALRETDASLGPAGPPCMQRPDRRRESSLPPVRMPLSQAYDAPTEAVPLSLAEGRISGGFVIVYPPDSPLVIPGELYTADVLEDIRFFREAGCTVSGIEEETVPCVIRE